MFDYKEKACFRQLIKDTEIRTFMNLQYLQDKCLIRGGSELVRYLKTTYFVQLQQNIYAL